MHSTLGSIFGGQLKIRNQHDSFAFSSEAFQHLTKQRRSYGQIQNGETFLSKKEYCAVVVQEEVRAYPEHKKIQEFLKLLILLVSPARIERATY